MSVWYLALLAVLMFGFNTVFWATVGFCRAAWGSRGRYRRADGSGQLVDHPGIDDVAVLMAAHNEADVIAASIRSACRLVRPAQVFVASDGSSDETVQRARAEGANVLDLQPNRGKAGALQAGVFEFGLAERFEVVLILDADTELDADYFRTGLPMFSDPGVAVVAGRAATQWHPEHMSWIGRAVVAHRERVYVALQHLVKYGQASSGFDAVTIAPGFASMYRSRVLAAVEMNPPGVVIEDFNMTFEIHKRDLGRIAFHPGAAVARTQDPDRVRDYRKQVRRWALGFWQTVRLHGVFHRGLFWWALGAYCVELVISALALLLTAGLVVTDVVLLVLAQCGVPVSTVGPPVLALLAIVRLPDLALSLLVDTATRRWYILANDASFPLLRLLDAWLCLSALLASFRVNSNGRWTSPTRRLTPSTSAARPAGAVTSSGGTP
jgi:cellulose synthase/poly-beta-1,6-N-acetylglucosamine synthase-like glycosyltransferase